MGDLIELPPSDAKSPEPLVALDGLSKSGLQKWCRHYGQKKLDVENRVLVCSYCEGDVNPYVALGQLFLDTDSYKRSSDRLEREAEERLATVEALKKEEQRIKGRIRRQNTKDAVQVEHARILERVANALDAFCDADTSTADMEPERAVGILWGLGEVVRGLFHPAKSPELTKIERRIDAAREEVDARRRRRGIRAARRRA